jgi:electron transfer flavoprotein alpha subunit
MSILAILEQRKLPEGHPAWNRMSWETLGAAQQIARELAQPACAAVLGQGIEGLAQDLGSKQLDRALLVEHPLLENYTPDAWSTALRQVIEHVKPHLVLFPHTYQVRDYLPKLATALGRVAVSDVVSHHIDNGSLVLVRQLFQGKVNADIHFATEPPNFVSLQAGAYRADQVAEGSVTVERFAAELSASAVRARPLDLFRESQRGVDLTAAELIVSVGRGIKEADNIPIVQKLADVMGAELAASRPICDAGWLPMERQVGSSGQTVTPKMYMAVGISGAIQHLVGMKGARTVVAINKDPNAPIFEIADYGIVGDLFQVVPELIEAIQKGK